MAEKQTRSLRYSPAAKPTPPNLGRKKRKGRKGQSPGQFFSAISVFSAAKFPASA